MEEIIAKVSVDSFIATFTTLFVFITGFLLNKIYDEWKESKDVSTVYKFFIQTIQSNLEGIEKQVKAFKDLSTDIKDTTIHDFKFITVTSINLNEYEKIDRVSLFKHLRFKGSDELTEYLDQTFNAMNLLKKQRINSKENFSKFMNKVSANQDKWMNNVDSILRLHDQFMSEIKNDSSNLNEFYKKIDEIFDQWVKTRDDENIEHTQTNLIDVIYTCCLEYLEDERAQKFLPHTIHAKYAHDNILNNHRIFHEHFKKDSEQANDSKKKIEDSLKKLDRNDLYGPTINKMLIGIILSYTIPIILFFISVVF